MDNTNEQHLLEMLLDLEVRYRTDLRKPFPYKDTRKLIAYDPKLYVSLVADLDQYFSMVAGYASWGENIAMWPNSKVREVNTALEKNFFDKHRIYEPLLSQISIENTPDLLSSLHTVESMRVIIIQALNFLEDRMDT